MTFKGPNKTYLAKLKGRADRINRYSELLEKRRQIIQKEIKKRRKGLQDIGSRISQKYRECKESYFKSWEDMGERLYKVLDCASAGAELDFESDTVSGVVIQRLSPGPEKTNSFPLSVSSSHFSAMLAGNRELLGLCFELAIEKKIIGKLSEELGKTTRKSNYLKNILLPQTRDEIKEIELKIEERERENLVRARIGTGILGFKS